MSTKADNSKKTHAFDAVKWFVVAVLVAAGIYANEHFSAVAAAYRALAFGGLAIIVAFIGFNTAQGAIAWDFLKESKVEMRKVVWPNRQETMQTTFVVVLLCVATALALWAMDSFLVWAIGHLAGNGIR